MSFFSWFFGQIKRADAEKRLMMRGLPNGTFLIRKAETAPTGGNLSLSIRDGESVRHYRIRKLDHGGYFIAARAPFSNLNDLVAHYMEESDGLICKLTMACPGMSCASSFMRSKLNTHFLNS